MKKLTKLQAKLLESINLNPNKPIKEIRELIDRKESQLGSDRRIIRFLCGKSYLLLVQNYASFDDNVYDITEEGKKALDYTYRILTCSECKKRPVFTYKFKQNRLCRDCLNKDEKVNLEDHVYNSDKGYTTNLHPEGFSPSLHEDVKIYSNLRNLKGK